MGYKQYLADELELRIPSIFGEGGSTGRFDQAFLIAVTDSWACSDEVPEAKCSLAKSVARLLRKDSPGRQPSPGRGQPGAVTLRAILGTKFPEVGADSLDMDLCIDQGLSRANKMRIALLVNAFSGILAALVSLPLGPFAQVTILVKMLVKMVTETYYDQTSCIFEVIGMFPGYRDQLLATDYSLFGAKHFWSYGAETAMIKCRNKKEKMMRLLKASKKAAARTAVPAAGVAGVGVAGGAAVGVAYVSIGGGAIITKAAIDASQLAGAAFGFAKLMPTVAVAGEQVPVLGLFLTVGQAIAGMHQAHTVYNWARFQTYRECSVGLRAELHENTTNFLKTYENARDVYQAKQEEMLPRLARTRTILTCLLGHATTTGDQGSVAKIRAYHEAIVDTVMAVTETVQHHDTNLKKVHKYVVWQHEQAKYQEKHSIASWEDKDKMEFAAEMLLNPSYYLLEKLFPNSKYVKVDTQQAYDAAKDEVEVQEQDEVEQEAPPTAYDTRLNMSATMSKTDGNLLDFCSTDDLRQPVKNLFDMVKAEIAAVKIVLLECSRQMKELTSLIATYSSRAKELEDDQSALYEGRF